MLILSLALASEPQATESSDHRSYMDQARFFLRKGWHADAAEQLELAVAHPDGKLDPEAWFLLAKVRYELTDVAGSARAAERAVVNSRDAYQAQEGRELLDYFHENFGWVNVHTDRGDASVVSLGLTSTLFDSDLKSYFNKLNERLSKGPLLTPAMLGLPVGVYTFNGKTVHVKAAKTTTVTLEPYSAPEAGQNALSVGVGGKFWFSDSANHLGPSVQTQLAADRQFGPMEVGATLSWATASFETLGGARQTSVMGSGIGVRAGPVFALGDLQLTPKVGYRLELQPGLETTCGLQGSDAVCDGTTSHVAVYPVGLSHVVYGEFAGGVDIGPFRPGARVGAGGAFAARPASASTTLNGRELPYSVASDQRGWTAAAAHLLADVAIRW